ncbi:MAG: hypothetical protein WC959_05545 [Kiritimatiellales bacterium]
MMLLAFFGNSFKPAADAITYGVNETVPLIQQGTFWLILCSGFFIVMQAAIGILQIKRLTKREPSITSEIDEKIKAYDKSIDKRFEGMSKKIDRIDAEIKDREKSSRETRAKLYDAVNKLREEVNSSLCAVRETNAAQNKQIEMMNQTQVRMDTKLDALISRTK